MAIEHMVLKMCFASVDSLATQGMGALYSFLGGNGVDVAIDVIQKCSLTYPLLEPFIWLFPFIAEAERTEPGSYQCVAKSQEAASRSQIVNMPFAMLGPALLVVVKFRAQVTKLSKVTLHPAVSAFTVQVSLLVRSTAQ